MARFNTAQARPRVAGPVTTTGPATTHEGAPAYARDAKSDLFLLAVTNMVGEDTFYEKADDRDQRYVDLIRQVAVDDPEWVLGFVGWLRTEANMRSASLVLAAEAVKARLDAKQHVDLHTQRSYNRKIIDAACQRPDEPAELLAYWTGRYGRNLPMPVKRGLRDAVERLLNEKALLKYDSDGKAVRMGDLIELVHPRAKRAWQDALYKTAIDRRHNRDNEIPDMLPAVRARDELNTAPVAERHDLVRRVLAGDEEAAEKLRLAMAGQWEWPKSWLGMKENA